jgi:PKHD-type hydroxylase
MAFPTLWYYTEIPKDLIDILEKDIKKFDEEVKESLLHGDKIEKSIRDSGNAWIPTSHWVGGFVWHYIQRANRENFLYDLTSIDGETIQYTQYGEGQYYNWHIDAGIDTFYKPQKIVSSDNNISEDLNTIRGEYVRKLSFSIQLSEPDEYSGGEVQFMSIDNTDTFFAPKQKGTIVIFDSRLLHRVRRVKSGLRKSLVGWVIGPRWR